MEGGSADTGSPPLPVQQSLQTAQCNLLPPESNDRPALIELLKSGDVRQFLGGALNSEDAARRADRIIAGANAGRCWSLHHRVDRRCIGLIGLAPHHDGQLTEISYQFLPAYWGKGIAFETVSAVIEYALMECKLARLVAETHEANTASRRLLQRCGMTEYRRL